MRYQTVDTNSGEVVAESNRHPLTAQLERRIKLARRHESAHKGLKIKKGMRTHLNADTLLVACLAGVAIGIAVAQWVYAFR